MEPTERSPGAAHGELPGTLREAKEAMSRKQILRALRWPEMPEVALPANAGPWTTYENRVAQFTKAVTTAGGRCVEVAPFFRHDNLKREVQQEVAKLAFEPKDITITDRIDDLVSLLEQVWNQ